MGLLSGLGSAFKTALGTGLGSAAGGLVGQAAGAIAFPDGKGLSGHDAYTANQYQNTHYHPTYYPTSAKYGLEKAGINPILAFNAKGVGGATGTGAGPGATADLSARTASSAQKLATHLSLAKLKSEVDNINADTKSKEQNVEESKSKISLYTTQKALNWSQKHLNDSRVLTEAVTQAEKAAKTGQAIVGVEEAQQRIMNLKATYNLTKEQTAKVTAELGPLLLQSEIAESDYGSAMAYVQKALPAVQTIMGGISAGALLNQIKSLGSNKSLRGMSNEVFKSTIKNNRYKGKN